MTFTFAKSAALAVLLALPMMAGAQTPFAGEDFDGGATNGGFSSTSMVFTPDNSGMTLRGTFANSGSGILFDRWGILSTDDNLPFGVVDESLDGFPTDTAGFVSEFKTDNFVMGVDTVNGNNPAGNVSATMSFDITGRTNIMMSIDMGMLGDFEPNDLYEFSYSIDGGPSQLAFRVQGTEGVFYSYTMDNGTFIDRFTSGFFDAAEWEEAIGPNPTQGVIDFHIRDNGINGDDVAEDGFVPVTFADGVEPVRAYQITNFNGTFNQEEFAPVKDPLTVTSGDGQLVNEIIPSDFMNFSTMLSGTGSTLTLTINGLGDGGDEYFAFDNILLSEGAAPGLFGDFEPDGDVDISDFGQFADAFGSVTGDPNYNLKADAEPDGDVDISDFGLFADNFGIGAATAATVPEPSTVVVAFSGLIAAAFAARRS